jgi:hypothetical protein
MRDVVVDRFTDLRGKHANEIAFIMGNGPSLNDTNLDLLEGQTVFASNAAFLLFERISWRPRYYFACDSRFVADRAPELQAMVRDTPDVELFTPSVMHHWDGSGRIEPTANYLPRGERIRHYRAIPISDKNLPFSGVSSDMDAGLIMPFTVTVNMIEAAVYMGFKILVLIGCDTSYIVPEHVETSGPNDALLTSTRDDPNHFDPSYFGAGRRWHQPHPERMMQHYAWARDAFAPRGVQIVNATVGGALEVFPRITLEECVAAATVI